MPIYVTLGNWTDQGTKDFGGAVQRANGFREMVEQAGGRARELVWTMGEYDFIIVAEAPTTRRPRRWCCGWARPGRAQQDHAGL
jgi:uncharacterized protein with GYD domain